jgi:xylan 1,4-beta-xylosidase
MSTDEMGSNELRVLVRDRLNFREEAPNGVKIGTNTRVFLRADIDFGVLRLSYSLNGVDYSTIGGKIDCTNLSDEIYGEFGHEGHTGTYIGLACQDLTGNHLHTDFRSFTYKAFE